MPKNEVRLKGPLGKTDQAIMRIYRVISYGSVFFLVAIMLIAFFNVLGEKILHKGIPASTELIKYFHVPTVFLCSGYVTLDRGQTAIDLLSSHFPKGLQKVCSIFSYLLGTVVSAFMGYRGLVQMGKHLSTHARSSTTGFGFPLWPFSLLFAIGFFMLAFSFVWSIVRMYAPQEEIPAGEFESDIPEGEPMLEGQSEVDEKVGGEEA